ncbi:MAG: hypothetical protein R3B09_06905 [Nannocystaceae bacterium]
MTRSPRGPTGPAATRASAPGLGPSIDLSLQTSTSILSASGRELALVAAALLVSSVALGCRAPTAPEARTLEPAAPRSDEEAAPEPAKVPERSAALVAGECHTCALDRGGGLRCWGCNDHGQLGDGTFDPRGTPAPVPGLGPVQRVALGPRGTCVVDDGGAVSCWGANTPALGLGAAADATAPVRIDGITDAVEVAVGDATACARTRAGAVHCWGEDRYRHFAGVQVGGVTRVDDDLGAGVEGRAIGVRVDARDTCVLVDDGRVLCWGADLGEWDPPQPPPEAGHAERHAWFLGLGGPRVAATGVSGFVAGARPICVWTGEGAARRWRCLPDPLDRGLAELHAASERDPSAAPTISAGHGCLLAGGRVRCVGDDGEGQVGASVSAGLDDLVEVAAGSRHTCARRASGAIVCWGEGARLATGDPSMALTPDPPAPDGAALRPLVGLSGVQDMSSGTCSISQGGRLRCLDRRRSRPAAGLRELVEVALGDGHTCARTRAGAVHCWGEWYFGPMNHDGDPSDFLRAPTPRRIAGLQAASIASWGESDCAVTSAGAIVCWGRWGDASLRPVPQEDEGTGWVDLAVSTWWFCARKADGRARCRRNERSGGTPPIELTEVAALSVADDRGCALRQDGRVLCWGAAPVGDGTYRRSDAPASIPEIDDAAEVRVGVGHTCVRRRGGELRCWGSNREGQLGDGTRVARARPTKVTEAPPRGVVVGVVALASSTIVWTDLGEAWIWGESIDASTQ